MEVYSYTFGHKKSISHIRTTFLNIHVCNVCCNIFIWQSVHISLYTFSNLVFFCHVMSLGVTFVTFLAPLKCNVSGFGDITPSFKDELLYDLYRVAVLIWIFFGLAYIGGLGKDCPFLSLFNLVWPRREKTCLESEKVSKFSQKIRILVQNYKKKI